MNNTHKAMAQIIARDYLPTPETFNKTLFSLLTNDLFALMGDEWKMTRVEEEKPHINEAISNIAFLLSSGTIEHRHAKEMLKAAWDTNQYAWDICWHLSDSKILEEKSGNELDQIILEVMKNNDKVVQDIKNGKKKAIGSLIGPIMRETGGKANPKEISKRISDLINAENVV